MRMVSVRPPPPIGHTESCNFRCGGPGVLHIRASLESTVVFISNAPTNIALGSEPERPLLGDARERQRFGQLARPPDRLARALGVVEAHGE